MNLERMSIANVYTPQIPGVVTDIKMHRLSPVYATVNVGEVNLCERRSYGHTDKLLCIVLDNQTADTWVKIHKRCEELVRNVVKSPYITVNGKNLLYAKLTDKSKLLNDHRGYSAVRLERERLRGNAHSHAHPITIEHLADRQVYRCEVTIRMPIIVENRGKFSMKLQVDEAMFFEPVNMLNESVEQRRFTPRRLERPDGQRIARVPIRPMFLGRSSARSSAPPSSARSSARSSAPIETKEVPKHFQEMFNKLPEEERNCPICLDEMTEDLTMTPCFHFFHGKCLQESRTRKNECPNCRQNL